MTDHHDDRIGTNTLRLLAERSDDSYVRRTCTEILTLRAEMEQLRADLKEAVELLDAMLDKEPETQAERWLLNRVNALLAKHKETP